MKVQGMAKIGNALSKNSPTILTGLSVAGFVTTVVMAVNATPKALEILAMEEEYRQEPIPKKEVIKLTWKKYIPTAIMGVTSITCIIGANSINLRRNAALASLCSLTEATLKEYKSKVVETIGEGKAKKIKDDIAADHVKNHPADNKEIIMTGNGEMLCLDIMSGRYFMSDVESIRKVRNDLNEELLNDDTISLNDVYYALGLDNTKMGDEVGWNIRDGQIDFDFSSQLNNHGQPCLVVDFKVGPTHDYRDYH
jgi:hypothetical protein